MDKAAKESVRSIMDFLFWIAVGGVVMAVLFFGFFKVSPYRLVNVHGPSMNPTLTDGDLIVLSTHENPERDEIAVFDLPEEWKSTVQQSTEAKLIKRVVGLPGDSITFNGSTVAIDSGSERYTLQEPRIVSCELPEGTTITVPQDEYFLAGDNRVQSFDSMAAWCAGLNPFVDKDTIGISGELKLRFSPPKF